MTIGVLKYAIFNCNIGWLGILGSTRGLQRLSLPQRTVREVVSQLGNSAELTYQSPHLFQDLIQRIKAYFNGRQIDFPDELDLSQVTLFYREVWEVTRLIPYGDTRTYSWVAEQIGKPKSARAVGQALSRNPLPIIVPCHRVIAKDGTLGGFTGGLAMKRVLLSLET